MLSQYTGKSMVHNTREYILYFITKIINISLSLNFLAQCERKEILKIFHVNNY